MIDMFTSFQVNIFIDASDILPETSVISRLLELFKDDRLIPSNIHEITGEGPSPRLVMSSPDNQWNIMFLLQKIHIVQYGNPNQPSDAMDGFSAKVKDFAKKIFEYLDRKSYRLAFIVNALFEEKTIEELQGCYNKLFIPLPTYQTNPPFEWNNRSISQEEISLAGTMEPVNLVTEIRRGKVKLKLDESITTIDRLLLQYEFNTAAENKDTRFNAEQFELFIDIAKSNYDGVYEKLEGVLNA